MIDLKMGDALEILKTIPNESIDCVVTDPPYKIATGGVPKNGNSVKLNNNRPKGILTEHSQLMRTVPKFSEWLPELFRVLKDGTQNYVMVNSSNLLEMANEIEKVGFKIQNFLVWQKNNCTPSQFYMKNCEYTIFFRKGKSKYINDIGGSKTVHSFDNIIGNKVHPTEKPIDLMEFYINNSTNENETVLDPFMGSGTTGVACKNLNRKFIGIEMQEDYFNIASERVKEKRKEKEIEAPTLFNELN
jgi:site-specific DNA-methyltransferase (adenine-specific)